MTTVRNLSPVQHGIGCDLSGEQPPLIPPGEYRLRLSHWQTVLLLQRAPKVVLHCEVCDFGPHFGVKLQRYYNVPQLVGKPARNGRFRAGWRGDLLRDYCRFAPPPRRLDRIYLGRLQELLLVGSVDTVTRDARQRPIPEALQYSVVRELIRSEAGAT